MKISPTVFAIILLVGTIIGTAGSTWANGLNKPSIKCFEGKTLMFDSNTGEGALGQEAQSQMVSNQTFVFVGSCIVSNFAKN
jgi:hypothetical protein